MSKDRCPFPFRFIKHMKQIATEWIKECEISIMLVYIYIYIYIYEEFKFGAVADEKQGRGKEKMYMDTLCRVMVNNLD